MNFNLLEIGIGNPDLSDYNQFFIKAMITSALTYICGVNISKSTHLWYRY